MVTFNTVAVGGLIVRTGWDTSFLDPVELLITIDYAKYPLGKGITERAIRHLDFRSMNPDTLKILGSLRVVGEWLAAHKPAFRQRPEDASLFFAHVALFYALAVQEGERRVVQVLANYAAVRVRMATAWVETARRLGMLTNGPAVRQAGKACGELTDKARAFLANRSTGPQEMAAA
jgi:hypothetical protein